MQPTILLLFLSTALALPSLQLRASNTTSISNNTCDPQKTTLLTDGIQRNIDLQKKEIQSLQTLENLSKTANTTLRAAANSTSPNDPIYKAQQSDVAKLQQEGITLRTENQKIAREMKSPSALQKGLASVAIEQNSARVMLRGLVAGRNDTAMIGALVKGVEEGMRVNGESLKVAKEGRGCGK